MSTETIDITPSWGEWGTIFARFVMSGETKAATALLPDVAQACAAAQALKSLSLTQEQSKVIHEIVPIEMAKAQSYLQAIPHYLRDYDEDDEIALQRQEDEQS